ncbi:10055_t:CDS:2 [Funneliformis caledonium]|uniref:10055_t:CDS:1 n=1 Tax=Funneliformis caledonium TaxID=1117310 RepID=A0A9N8VDF2_9GLOM|nr:10055_t:CDS:2 [Funneliformis caledonium]
MVKNSHQLSVFLENTGLLVQELHYGPYSRFWWDFSNENNIANFPIRLGQQVKVSLNGHDFFLTVRKETGSLTLPEYYCKIGQIEVTETSLTKAISTAYAKILKNDVEFFPVMCLTGKYKIFLYAIGCSLNEKWRYAGSDFQSSIIHTFEKKQGIFVSRIENNKYIVKIYQNFQLKKRFIGISPDDVWKKVEQIQKYNGTQLFGLII